ESLARSNCRTVRAADVSRRSLLPALISVAATAGDLRRASTPRARGGQKPAARRDPSLKPLPRHRLVERLAEPVQQMSFGVLPKFTVPISQVESEDVEVAKPQEPVETH